MPIYEYKCKKCNNVFETFREIDSDDKQVKCPMCGQKHSKRIISIFSSSSSYNCMPHFSSG